MGEKLKFFLEAKNLDILQLAKDQLGELEEKEILLIRSILNKWEPSLALSNLLFNPSILPPTLQNKAILTGIGDKQNQYIILAATVGLQEINPQNFSVKEKEIIVDSLLNIIKRYQNVLANRASISILPFLSENDKRKVIIILPNTSETARHNLLGWLYQKVAHCSYAELREKLGHEKISRDTLEEIEKELDKDEQRVNKGLPSLLVLPLYTYIPRRDEM